MLIREILTTLQSIQLRDIDYSVYDVMSCDIDHSGQYVQSSDTDHSVYDVMSCDIDHSALFSVM